MPKKKKRPGVKGVVEAEVVAHAPPLPEPPQQYSHECQTCGERFTSPEYHDFQCPTCVEMERASPQIYAWVRRVITYHLDEHKRDYRHELVERWD